MEYTKEIFVKDYLDIHNFYSNIYGKNRTLILMQVGSFHECYATNEDGPKLVRIAEQLDVICTKKNGKEPVSKSNHMMLGFPIHVTDNYIEKLCNLNYTVIKIDQTSSPPKPTREVVGIFSSSTLINKPNNKTNNIVSIVIEQHNNLLCFGLSSYDLTTGSGSFYETYSKQEDLMFSLDDSLRYLNIYPPKEVILYHNLNEDDEFNNMKLKDILKYLELDENIIFNYNNFGKKNVKVSFQKVLFESIFKNKTNIFEILNLHLYNLARLSLTNLFEYAKNHQILLIEKLKLPVQFDNDKILYLGNKCLDQLNVINKNTENSLFNIINFTKTIMGKRFLESSLSKPLIDNNDIISRLNLIENFILNDNYKYISELLEDICDLERLNRRIELGILHPYELNKIYLSFYQIDKLTDYFEKNNLESLCKSKVTEFINYIKNTFYLDKIININFNNYYESDDSFIKTHIYEEIDSLHNKIESSTNFMDNLVTQFDLLIDDKKIFSKKQDSTTINMKYNERDGHYLLLTNRRCSILQKKLESITELNVGSIILDVKDLEFVQLPKSTSTKINCKKLKSLSSELVEYKTQLAKLLKEKFKDQLNYIVLNFSDIINYWAIKIAFIDFINSGAICSIKNHYTKPNIVENKDSYFKATNLRHNIVEIINNEFEYKPQTLALGGNADMTGILLYGINSSGKSTLMKSVGLNVILAQIGYYVAASYFELSPYKSIFTRIGNTDNIYRGLSSFMVEMIDLTSILKRNNSNTLILADEIASTTEARSANIIVAYMLKTLSESNATFITATHLHEVSNLSTVVKLKNIKSMHLKITYDQVNDKLIYDRELLEGQGESFYGLQVAKYLMKDTHFNNITDKLLIEYDNRNVKHSKYNIDNYLIECEICKLRNSLETHHIEFQKDFNEKEINKNNLHYQKNANYNLVTLCRTCHDDIDRQKIMINGWKETSKGRELDYYLNDLLQKQSKYSDELINYIKLLKNETLDPKFARIKIKETFNKKISTKSILNLWN
jgi:DNA mismatch repair protein MutS